MKLLETAEDLKDWAEYRIYLRERLKLLSPEPEPAFISKARFEFDLGGKVFRSYAVIFGKKSRQMAMKLRKEGVLFLEGTVSAQGKKLSLSGFADRHLAGAEKTFTRSKLGIVVVPRDEARDSGPRRAAGEPDEDDSGGDSRREARERQTKLKKAALRIEKAVVFWGKTEILMTRQLRQLQRQILSMGDPRAKALVRSLEDIRTRLEKIDDEAREASEAAARGDAKGFVVARKDFLAKANRILKRVQQDELIRMADENPLVSIQLQKTLSSSLVRLMKAV